MARSLSPDGILRPTAAPHAGNVGPIDDRADGEPEPRGRRVAPAGKVSGRKFQIPDAIFERLQLHAIKKRSNPSAVLTDILDRELPKHKIATEEG